MRQFGSEWLLGVAAGLALLTGCGRSTEDPKPDDAPDAGSGCSTDSDCSGDELCRVDDRTCVTCLSDMDCTERERCSSGECREELEPNPVASIICDPGTRTCNGPDVEVCSPDGTRWSTEETCATAQLCEEGECHYIQCVPNQKLCRDNGVWACASDGLSAAPITACYAEQFCQEDATGARCSATQCSPSATLCSGAVATKCKADGSGPEAGGEDCEALSLICSDGECRKHVCTPGEKRCQGGDVYLCTASGTSTVLFAECANDEVCDASSGSCRERICEPGTQSCDGSSARVCNELGTGWQDSIDCASDGGVCEDGSCTPKVCEPYAAFCKDLDVYVCDARGLGGSLAADCGPFRYCVSEGSVARCVPYDCQPGTQACLGNQIGTCASNGLALSALSLDCAGQSQLCTPQLSCASTAVDTFGVGTGIQTRSSGFFVGDFVDVLSTRKLKQLEVRLSLPDARNLQFQVYEVTNGVGLTLRLNELVSNQVGDGYAASPALDSTLKAGTQYLFGVVVTGGNFDAYLDTMDPYTVVASLGRPAGRMSALASPYPPLIAEPYAFLYNIKLTTTPAP